MVFKAGPGEKLTPHSHQLEEIIRSPAFGSLIEKFYAFVCSYWEITTTITTTTTYLTNE